MECPTGGSKADVEAESARQELKLSTYIKNMDEELRERFMALKVLEDTLKIVNKEE